MFFLVTDPGSRPVVVTVAVWLLCLLGGWVTIDRLFAKADRLNHDFIARELARARKDFENGEQNRSRSEKVD
jgi:hypothetical protein